MTENSVNGGEKVKFLKEIGGHFLQCSSFNAVSDFLVAACSVFQKGNYCKL